MINFTAWPLKPSLDETWPSSLPACFARIEFLLKCLQTKAREEENVRVSWHLCYVAPLSKGQPCQKDLLQLLKGSHVVKALAPHEEEWKKYWSLTGKAVLCSTLDSWSKAIQDCITNMDLDLWKIHHQIHLLEEPKEGLLTLAKFKKSAQCLQLSVSEIKV